jgi:hypothetical protein
MLSSFLVELVNFHDRVHDFMHVFGSIYYVIHKCLSIGFFAVCDPVICE